MTGDIVVVDIDGILTDYPKCFLDWVEKNKGLRFVDLDCMKKSMAVEEYERIKADYRSSGVKRELPVSKVFFDAIVFFKEHGFVVWIVTTRPDVEPVRSDTLFWLDSNKVRYDDVFFVVDKKSFLRLSSVDKRIVAVIDDRMRDLIK